MLKIRTAMVYIIVCAFVFNASGMRGDDRSSKKPKLPKFEALLTSNHQEDSETEDEQQIYASPVEEDSETEEMQEDLYVVNQMEPHQFFIHPHLRFAQRHRNDYEQTEEELNKLMNLFQTEAPRDEDWYELNDIFASGAIHIGNFFHHDDGRRRITTEYMRNMNTLYRYMYKYNLLRRFPHIKKFFDRWIKKEGR